MNGSNEQEWRIDAGHGPGPVLANRDLVPLRPALPVPHVLPVLPE